MKLPRAKRSQQLSTSCRRIERKPPNDSSPIRTLACLIAFSIGVFAQQATNATLTGMVTDPHGAFVSGANITATHKATGVKREATSNNDGLYVLSNLPPGEYELRVEATGFTTKVTKTGIALKVGQTVTLNVPLEVNVSEAVDIDVDLRRRLIDHNASLVDGVVDSEEVQSSAAQRPQLSRAGVLDSRQQPSAEFRPDQNEYRSHLVGRSTRTRWRT